MHRTGGPSVFKYEEVPLPKPRRGEVLIEVHSAGVNPVDTKIRQGKFPRYKAALPATLGRDFAGVVRGVSPSGGGGRSPFKAGDEVFGMLDYNRGAYAEYTIASPREMARRPAKVTEKEAGVLGVAALTAWQGLFDHGRLKKGQRVLIHGAAGGVGHFAVQFAKAKGATVVATASKRDLKWVHKLGADQVIDFENERFEEHTGGIDVVLALVAGDTIKRSWEVLKPKGGIIVSTLEEPDQAAARRHHARGLRMMVTAKRGQLEKIAAMVAKGQVKVMIDKVFSLRHVREAHEYLEKGHVRGKVSLDTVPSWTDLELREAATGKGPEADLAVLASSNVSGFTPFI
jgi:NADPH:quinone reductase-like Zn-dependent oxidoreductase